MMPQPGQPLAFTKYQGAGNDFILLDWRWDDPPSATTIQLICHRHFGIGADGLLLLNPARPPATRPRMILFNADGSRPEMCGNGVRCAALHVLLTSLAPGSLADITLETDAGPRRCEILESSLSTANVRVDMGIVTQPTERVLDSPPVRLQVLSVGNPHAVLFEDRDRLDLATLGPALATHSQFPEGINVGFARVVSRSQIDLQVWERGAGPTLACGTGACAAVAAAWATNRIDPPDSVRVQLPGGRVTVQLDTTSWRASLSGPATRVFAGVIDWPG